MAGTLLGKPVMYYARVSAAAALPFNIQSPP